MGTTRARDHPGQRRAGSVVESGKVVELIDAEQSRPPGPFVGLLRRPPRYGWGCAGSRAGRGNRTPANACPACTRPSAGWACRALQPGGTRPVCPYSERRSKHLAQACRWTRSCAGTGSRALSRATFGMTRAGTRSRIGMCAQRAAGRTQFASVHAALRRRADCRGSADSGAAAGDRGDRHQTRSLCRPWPGRSSGKVGRSYRSDPSAPHGM